MAKTPPHYDNWTPQRQQRYDRKQRPARTPPQHHDPQQGNVPGSKVPPYKAPRPAQPVPNFLPDTPGFENDYRQLTDGLNSNLADINAQRMTIPGQVAQFQARSGNDQAWANTKLDESLAERGMFESGTNPYLRMRDVQTPFGRANQDFQASTDDMLRQLATGESQAYLSYNQGMGDAMLDRAGEVEALSPMSNQFPGSMPNYGQPFGLGNTTGPTPNKKNGKKNNGKKDRPPRRDRNN